MTNSKISIVSFISLSLLFSTPALSQSEKQGDTNQEGEFQGFSAQLYPAKKTLRGSSIVLADLLPFSTGAIKNFEIKEHYQKIFLGSDFFEVATTQKSCDSLRNKIGKVKSHFIPVSDGFFFYQSKFQKIDQLSGYYMFRNSKNLPGILPNVDVWVKIETYRRGNVAESNCLVIKFLIPEDHDGKISEKGYVMRNDGVLQAIAPGTDPDFSLKLDFEKFCIYPLNDINQTTHLVGKEFNILGSFARQRQCEAINGLLFPTSRKGNSNGCVFFRKVPNELASKF